MKAPTQEVTLDDVDRKIVDQLVHDARRPYGEIGKVVHLSAPAVKRRIDRLEERGVIVGYTAVLDHGMLGRPLEAFAELRFSGNARVDEIAGIATDIPEVQAVFTVAGDPDALVLIRVRDVQDLKRVIDQIRGKGHVTGTKTLMVLGTYRNPEWVER